MLKQEEIRKKNTALLSIEMVTKIPLNSRNFNSAVNEKNNASWLWEVHFRDARLIQ